MLGAALALVDSELVDQLCAYGEYRLCSDRFDRRCHYDLAKFKAWETLQALAQRLGVVLHGETRESYMEVEASTQPAVA